MKIDQLINIGKYAKNKKGITIIALIITIIILVIISSVSLNLLMRGKWYNY